MKHVLLIVAFIGAFAEAGFALNFAEAIQSKKIQIVSSQSLVLEEKDFQVEIKNISGKTIRLTIPVGTYFEPDTDDTQPRFIAENTELLLAKNESKTVHLSSVCMAATKRSPSSESRFYYQPTAKGQLADLIVYLQQQVIPFEKSDVQSAVWAVTNQHRIEAIANDSLKSKMSRITGQKPQSLKFTYQHQNIPGQVAYNEKELRVEGLFRYGTEKDITANLGLYDKDGKLVKMLRPNMLHRRGQHSFRFDFTITNVKPGDFFIRLTTGKDVLNEMAVVF
jgi:hypothetical protein